MITGSKIIELAIVVFLISGGILMQIITSTLECGIDNSKCGKLLYSVGAIIIAPQSELYKAIEELKDKRKLEKIDENVRVYYVSSLQTKILIMTLVSFIYIYLAFRLVEKLTLRDFGSLIVVFLFVVLLLGVIQSAYTYFLEKKIVYPWFGFIELFKNYKLIIDAGSYKLSEAYNATGFI